MCNGDFYFVMALLNKFHGALSLRCDVYQPDQSTASFLQTQKHFFIRRHDVFRVLCTGFFYIDKWSFHIDAD